MANIVKPQLHAKAVIFLQENWNVHKEKPSTKSATKAFEELVHLQYVALKPHKIQVDVFLAQMYHAVASLSWLAKTLLHSEVCPFWLQIKR